MNIYAVVFYNVDNFEPLDHVVFVKTKTKYERKIIEEFVNFGKKELIKKIRTDESEINVKFANSFYMYITNTVDVGVAILSPDESNDNLIHIVSRKLISDYVTYNITPNITNINHYFKSKKLLTEIDTTKKILMRSVSKIIERGENIDDLVHRTELLSTQSKIFFKGSRKLNSCCWLPRRWFGY